MMSPYSSPVVDRLEIGTLKRELVETHTAVDDAIDAAMSVDGSLAPSECGSDATSAFAGADGFENIALSRAAAARAERARREGDVPWVRWWERRANAYDALLKAQPALKRLARRVARAALEWSTLQNPSFLKAGQPPLVAVDLAAGAGLCAWSLAHELRRRANGGTQQRTAADEQRSNNTPAKNFDARSHRALRCELVEPSHSMAALARARAAHARLGGAGGATVWQIPVERCHERLPARLLGAVDVATCSASMQCLNEHDVSPAAFFEFYRLGNNIPVSGSWTHTRWRATIRARL